MEITPIGYITTPYKEKFAIPRQPGLAPAAKGVISITREFSDINAFRGIETFSHLWLIFQFHQVPLGQWRPLVRPPRLGGNAKQGVFATRSTHRPNNMGMSVVKLEQIEQQQGQVLLHVSGIDLLDQTPIFDIKPYIQYVDSIETAHSGFAPEPPPQFPVIFTHQAQHNLDQLPAKQYPQLSALIKQVLSFNPCPAYQHAKNNERLYGVQLFDLNITWLVKPTSTLEGISENSGSLVIEVQDIERV